MRTSPLFRAMSFALFFMVITFYVLCYSVNRVYAAAFPDEASLSVFFGWLGVATGVAALLLQIFATNRLIRRFGVRKMNLVFPSMALLGFAGLLASFTLYAAMLGSVIKDALMPAIRNPVRALFFNALPAFIQGRAHAISIGLVLPLALLVAGAALVIAQSLNNAGLFLLLGSFAGIAYWAFNRRMNASYVQAIVSTLREKLFVPDEQFDNAVNGDEQQVFRLLCDAAAHKDPEIRFMAAKTLMDVFPDKAPPIVLRVLDGLRVPLRNQLIALLIPLEPPELKEYLFKEVQGGDEHLKATALSALFQIRAAEAKGLVNDALESGNPRICAAGIFGALNYPIGELETHPKQRWRSLLSSGDKGQVLAALDLLARWPQRDFIEKLRPHFYSGDKRVTQAAIAVLDKWPDEIIPGLDEIVAALMRSDEPQIRAGIVRHLRRLPDAVRLRMAQELIEDDHPDVRTSAARVLFPATADIATMEAWIFKNRNSPKAQQVVLSLLLARCAPRDVWQRIAHYLSAKASEFYAAYLDLQQHAAAEGGPLELACIVLHERAMQTLDLVLYCAMQYEDINTLSVIRAGVKVKDRQQWAATTEAVRYIDDKILARSLTALLEIISGDVPERAARKIPDVSSVLQWIEEQGDPWLTQCVQPVRAIS
jgi:HEAT repeat protein